MFYTPLRAFLILPVCGNAARAIYGLCTQNIVPPRCVLLINHTSSRPTAVPQRGRYSNGGTSTVTAEPRRADDGARFCSQSVEHMRSWPSTLLEQDSDQPASSHIGYRPPKDSVASPTHTCPIAVVVVVKDKAAGLVTLNPEEDRFKVEACVGAKKTYCAPEIVGIPKDVPVTHAALFGAAIYFIEHGGRQQVSANCSPIALRLHMVAAIRVKGVVPIRYYNHNTTLSVSCHLDPIRRISSITKTIVRCICCLPAADGHTRARNFHHHYAPRYSDVCTEAEGCSYGTWETKGGDAQQEMVLRGMVETVLVEETQGGLAHRELKKFRSQETL
ncbi:hypothetical protein IW262DRAFT_1291158 [Armillaria fumosa]|nr:hypothetical protein IW262DRAFT_1291158 [Armillaria fumosa]